MKTIRYDPLNVIKGHPSELQREPWWTTLFATQGAKRKDDTPNKLEISPNNSPLWLCLMNLMNGLEGRPRARAGMQGSPDSKSMKATTFAGPELLTSDLVPYPLAQGEWYEGGPRYLRLQPAVREKMFLGRAARPSQCG